MKRMLLNLYRAVLAQDYEKEKLVEFARAFAGRNARVLDVGCGYGRNLRRFSEAGFSVVGVEKNPLILAKNRSEGFQCLAPEELAEDHGKFDLLLFSHVVEHFAPDNLIRFMDHYLKFLKDGGKVVIATPLMTKYFYDDFDHVKPYTPQSFLMLWGRSDAQIQFVPRESTLILLELWFRKTPLRLDYCREKYLRSSFLKHAGFRAAELLLGLFFFLSCRVVSKTDAWVGVFEMRQNSKQS